MTANLDRFPTVESCLDFLERQVDVLPTINWSSFEGSDTDIAGQCLWVWCWVNVDVTPGAVQRLVSLEQKYRPVYPPDQFLEPYAGFLYLLLAGSSVLALGRLENGLSEHAQDVIERAGRVLRQIAPRMGRRWFLIVPPLPTDRMELTVFKPLAEDLVLRKHSSYLGDPNRLAIPQVRLVQCLIPMKLFATLVVQCRYVEALEWLAAGFSSWSIIYSLSFSEEIREDDEQQASEVWQSQLLALLAEHWGLAKAEEIVFQLLGRESVVIGDADLWDSFESLTQPREVDWETVARACSLISESYGLFWGTGEAQEKFCEATQARKYINGVEYVRFSHTASGIDPVQLWSYLAGVARSKLSPDAYIRLRKQEECVASQKRLRAYFFGQLWDELPEQAKGHLINADRLFHDREGAQQSICNELRLATEAVLEQTLWEPYCQWLQGKTLTDNRSIAVARNQRSSSGTFIGQMLGQLWPTPDFADFVKAAYADERARRFVMQELRKALRDLNALRIDAEHPHDRRRQVSTEQVREIYRYFLGIGQRGIIPRLLELKLRFYRMATLTAISGNQSQPFHSS